MDSLHRFAAGADNALWLINPVSGSYNKSDTSVITITIAKQFAGACTVRLNVTGGKEAGEDYGLGKHFTGSGTWVNAGYQDNYTVVSFAVADATKNVTLTVVNNPTIEPDRVLTLSLSNPSNGSITGGSKTITIVDDNRDYQVDITSQSQLDVMAVAESEAAGYLTALIGDDATDNSVRWNGIINFLKAKGKTAVLYLPDGSYRVVELTGYPGVSNVGQSKTGTIVKRTTGNAARKITDESLFRVKQDVFAVPQLPMAFANLTLDGDNNYHRAFVEVVNWATVVAGDYFKLTYYIDGVIQNDVAFTFVDAAPAGANEIRRDTAGNNATLCTRIYSALVAVLGAGWTVTQISTTLLSVRRGDGSLYTYHTTSGLSATDVYVTNNEQSSLAAMAGSALSSVRLPVYFENILIKDNQAGQGLMLLGNLDHKTYQISKSTNDFARGGIVTGMDNCSYQFKSIDLPGDFFHMEVDDGYTGLVETTIDDLNCAIFLANVGFHANATLYGKGITATNAWGIIGNGHSVAKDQYKIEDSDLHTGDWIDKFTTGAFPYLYCNTFNRADFYNVRVTVDDNGLGASDVRSAIPRINLPWAGTNGGWFFDTDCTFTGIRNIGLGKLFVALVYGVGTGYNPSANNPFDFTGVHFDTFDYLVASEYAWKTNGSGGVFRFHGACTFANILHFFSLYEDGGVWWELMVDNLGNLTGIGDMGYMRGGGNTPNNKIFWEGTTLTLAQNTLSYWGDLALAFTSKRVDLAAGMMREIINTGADVSAGFGMFNTNGDGLGGDTYDKINQDTDVVCTGQGRSGEATWA